jgi:hypothetical protein
MKREIKIIFHDGTEETLNLRDIVKNLPLNLTANDVTVIDFVRDIMARGHVVGEECGPKRVRIIAPSQIKEVQIVFE